ncbi:MAG: MATE family efflux transporter [Gammaproteobacteria bacterium]|nr:MATE family efflux transporter [Gammaproteobacteria bacterium]
MKLSAKQQHQLRVEMRRALTVSLPLIGAQLLHVGNAVIDTMIAGRIGRVELAAGGVGAAIFTIVLLAGIGLMGSLSPTMARAIGRSQRSEVGYIFRQGLWLAALIGIAAFLVLTLVIHTLPHWGLAPELIPQMQSYLQAVRWGMPPALVFLAARNVCEATGGGRAVLIVQAIGLVVNLLGNLALGLGWFGFPALGLTGIGWTTAIVMLSMAAIILWLLTGRHFVSYKLYARFDQPDLQELKRLLRLSSTIAMTLLFEAGLFTATAIQMGKLGAIPASAHNIAIGVAALFYMLPLGLGMTLTARVSVAVGRNSRSSLHLRVWSGIGITLLMALASATALILFREQIPWLYTSDAAVHALTAQLLLMAAVFQISDDFQVTLISMLRGMHDTRVPMLINAFSYWVIAFGIGYYATHYLGFGAHGLWFALIVGLTISAALLSWRLRWKLANAQKLMQPVATVKPVSTPPVLE